MAEYTVPKDRESAERKNNKTKMVTASKARTFTEEEVLALLSKAKEVNTNNE